MSETKSSVGPTHTKPLPVMQSTSPAPEPSPENAAHAAALKAAYKRGYDEGFEKGYSEGLEGRDAIVGVANEALPQKGMIAVYNLHGEMLHIHPSTIDAHKNAGWYLPDELPPGAHRHRRQ